MHDHDSPRQLEQASFVTLTQLAIFPCTTGTERTDYTFRAEPMHVIWALGQEYGREVHFPASGLEAGTSKQPNFYRRDELKYHGHVGQRGVTTVRWLGEQTLIGSLIRIRETKSPNQCCRVVFE